MRRRFTDAQLVGAVRLFRTVLGTALGLGLNLRALQRRLKRMRSRGVLLPPRAFRGRGVRNSE